MLNTARGERSSFLMVQALYKVCRCYFTHYNIICPQWDNNSEQTTVIMINELQFYKAIDYRRVDEISYQISRRLIFRRDLGNGRRLWKVKVLK